MYVTELMVIFIAPLIVWFWLESMKVHERARLAGARACQKNNVQFLDDTVHLTSVRLGKNNYGQLCLMRTFAFEFTNNEYQRYQGKLVFAGKILFETHMDAYRINEFD